MASKKLNESVDNLVINDGEIKSITNNNITSYWELIGDQKFNSKIEKFPQLKSINDYKLVGKTNLSKGFDRIMCGKETFVHDLELPKMLHARVIRPPFYSARINSLNLDKVKSIKNVFHIEQDGSFLAVISEKEEKALKVANILRKNIEY